MAEKLVRNAASEYELAVRVYRPGFVTWHSRTGAAPQSSFVARLAAEIARSGHFPAIAAKQPSDIEAGDGIFLNLTPVDYLSRALLHLAFAPSSQASAVDAVRTYHLVHGSGVVRLSHLLDAIRQRGRTLTPQAYAEWTDAIAEAAERSPLFEYWNALTRHGQQQLHEFGVVSDEATRALLPQRLLTDLPSVAEYCKLAAPAPPTTAAEASDSKSNASAAPHDSS